MRAFTVLLLICGVGAKISPHLEPYEKLGHDYTVDLCMSAGSVNEFGNPKNGKLSTRSQTHVFLGQGIQCEGRIAEWEFYAKAKGTFFAGLFRPNMDTGTVQLVGCNRIPVQTTNQIHYCEVPLHRRIHAEVGDVVGIFFSEKEDKDNPNDDVNDSNTILSVERDDMPRSTYNTDNLGEVFVLEGMTNETLIPGEVYRINYIMPTRMSIALRAQVKGISRMLRFADMDVSRRVGEGRAEIFWHGIWGTICDKWFHQRGWPFLFCREMGFPDSLFSFYTDTERRHKAKDNIPIHVKNPRCKPSQNRSMVNCDRTLNQFCNDHSYDLYIICRRRVELRYGAVAESEGIAFLYDNGYWGTICDMRDPDFDIEHTWEHGVWKKVLWNHWCTVFCFELGFSGCDDIFYASFLSKVNPAALAHVSKYAIASQTPNCTVDGAFSMAECPPSPKDKRCGHLEDYYIICHKEHGY